MPLPSKQRAAMLVMFALAIGAIAPSASAEFAVSITIAPPPLPVYEQPVMPGDGFIWTPGYWAYGPEGYFWVPGTWVQAPAFGLLWTPGYWGWSGGVYAWNAGYWGRHIGFYGGVNYGFGYTGRGYEGGYWQGNRFFYNRSVNNVNVTNVTNVYNKTVVNNVTVNKVSYNGGTGGIAARPTAAEQSVAHEVHQPPTAAQTQHHQAASTNHALLASVNQGRPSIAATARAGEFSGRGVVTASRAGAAAPVHPAASVPTQHTTGGAYPATRPAMTVPSAAGPRSGSAAGSPTYARPRVTPTAPTYAHPAVTPGTHAAPPAPAMRPPAPAALHAPPQPAQQHRPAGKPEGPPNERHPQR